MDVSAAVVAPHHSSNRLICAVVSLLVQYATRRRPRCPPKEYSRRHDICEATGPGVVDEVREMDKQAREAHKEVLNGLSEAPSKLNLRLAFNMKDEQYESKTCCDQH